MAEMVFLKLGGSLITEKAQREAPRRDVLQRVAGEIAAALAAAPGLRLVLGHGSGSYGHFAAERYGVHRGHLADWRGYAETAAAAARLDRLVIDALLAAGVPAVALQPSASARTCDGQLQELVTWPLGQLLKRGLVPVVFGDVALDDTQGSSIISTEQIFEYLARQLVPQRILLAGEVDGVYTADPHLEPEARPIPRLSPAAWQAAERQLAGACGVDVTGGMRSKVRQMLALVQEVPGLQVSVFSGLQPGRVEAALLGRPGGTLLVANHESEAQRTGC
ncbi:MAG TPA: isopentenyl phosphate kinase [Anaerolineae bacterium]|nr:isopentenyl phosphate kinase [Anaerolineae bacterium]HPL30088.1 isopentenyl phosphate kinase [Anaerolineae bacterium]